MATDRKLINYLPSFMQVYRELAIIMETEQVEIDRVWLETENTLTDQFILEATENGISRWESMLGISPKSTDTLDERRFSVVAKMNQELPYTMRKLMQFLTNLCGEGSYSVEINAAEYKVTVKLGLASKNNYGEVEKILKKMIPANMIQSVEIMYNSNATLTQLTHNQLSAYTHEQLRSEVFTNG